MLAFILSTRCIYRISPGSFYKSYGDINYGRALCLPYYEGRPLGDF